MGDAGGAKPATLPHWPWQLADIRILPCILCGCQQHTLVPFGSLSSPRAEYSCRSVRNWSAVLSDAFLRSKRSASLQRHRRIIPYALTSQKAKLFPPTYTKLCEVGLLILTMIFVEPRLVSTWQSLRACVWVGRRQRIALRMPSPTKNSKYGELNSDHLLEELEKTWNNPKDLSRAESLTYNTFIMLTTFRQMFPKVRCALGLCDAELRVVASCGL
jgi:hypothetical protein